MEKLSFNKTNHEYQRERFDRLKRRYMNFGIPFRTSEYNSVKEIEVDTKKIRINLSTRRVAGVHLARVFLLNVNKRISEGLYEPKNKDNSRRNVHTIYYNEDSCIKSVGKKIKAIDINSCYWNTSYLSGVIDEKTYKTGFKKEKEYKDARNIAIGCLGKNRNVVVFDGKEEVENYYSPMETACVRLDIIDYVYNLSLEISKELGKSFLFYLTDCFFVDAKAEKKCIKLIESKGYTCKVQDVEMKAAKQINQRTFAVMWLKAGKKKESIHHFNRVRHELSTQKKINY